jgi:hypothetical protein
MLKWLSEGSRLLDFESLIYACIAGLITAVLLGALLQSWIAGIIVWFIFSTLFYFFGPWRYEGD